MTKPTADALLHAEKILGVFIAALRRAGFPNDALEKTVVRAVAMALPQWQPITDAQKKDEGKEILALHQPSGECCIVFWARFPSSGGGWQIKQSPGRDPVRYFPVRYFAATHWMKLPESLPR
jgi:hypothetical protein